MLLWECADIEASLPWYPVILLGKGMCQEAFTRKGYISIPTTHIFKKKKKVKYLQQIVLPWVTCWRE